MPADKTYDLSFVDPHRRAEVVRRIEAVERFMKAPGRRAAEAAAKELGLGYSIFYALVRSWRRHADPAKLPGARTQKPSGSRNYLNEDQRSVIRWANEIARNQNVERAVEVAVGRALVRNIEMPSKQTIRAHIKRLRTGTLPPELLAYTYMVDHCSIELAVAGPEGEPVKPVLTVVFTTSPPKLLGVALSMRVPSSEATARAFASALPRMQLEGTPRPTLLFDRPDEADWEAVAQDLAARGIDVCGELLPARAFEIDKGAIRKRGNGRVILAAFGRNVLGFTIRARAKKLRHSLAQANIKVGASPLGLKEAETLLQDRLDALDRHGGAQ